jgi:hypothetical protein
MQRNVMIAAVVTATIVAAIAWLLMSGGADASKAASAQSAAKAAADPKAKSATDVGAAGLAPQNVLAIRPNAPKPSAMIETAIKGASASAPYKESELARAYRLRESAQSILARIVQTPNDGEALRIKAKIFETCGKVKNDEWDKIFKENKEVVEMEKTFKTDPRGAFIKSLQKDDPEAATRIAAFDRLNPRFCNDLEGMEMTGVELNSLYASAAKLGDVPSIARELACGIASSIPKISPNQTFAEQFKQEPVKIELTSARQSQLLELLRAGHPDSIEYLMWTMNQDYKNVRVRLPGQIGRKFDPQDFFTKRALKELIACDLGKPCGGADNPDLDRRCANQGQCNLQSIPDAIHFYELSPAYSQNVEKTRQALREAIATGNFNELKFEPVGNNPYDAVNFNMSAGDEIGCRR